MIPWMHALALFLILRAKGRRRDGNGLTDVNNESEINVLNFPRAHNYLLFLSRLLCTLLCDLEQYHFGLVLRSCAAYTYLSSSCANGGYPGPCLSYNSGTCTPTCTYMHPVQPRVHDTLVTWQPDFVLRARATPPISRASFMFQI